MKIVNKENSNTITAIEIINNHNCMVFNSVYLANINCFTGKKQSAYFNGLNYRISH